MLNASYLYPVNPVNPDLLLCWYQGFVINLCGHYANLALQKQ
jgi:hypothetical protein